MSLTDPILLIIVPSNRFEDNPGKYVWDWVFEQVNFIPKGKRTPSWKKPCGRNNSYVGAMKIACRHLGG